MTAAVEAGRTCAVLSAAPSPVVTPQPTTAATSAGMSSSYLTTAFSWTSSSSAKDPSPANCAIAVPSWLSRGLARWASRNSRQR